MKALSEKRFHKEPYESAFFKRNFFKAYESAFVEALPKIIFGVVDPAWTKLGVMKANMDSNPRGRINLSYRNLK